MDDMLNLTRRPLWTRGHTGCPFQHHYGNASLRQENLRMLDLLKEHVHSGTANLFHHIGHGLNRYEKTVIDPVMKLDQREVFRNSQAQNVCGAHHRQKIATTRVAWCLVKPQKARLEGAWRLALQAL